ncbi:DUF1816 domain-containing protein [Tumidithrix helvetica PCC 7403]|uniref:DUF1816 domain-containing protein n=1 Tax=Tumidithrix helvetica TaxID=3457545 RepID=UPI003CC239F4
MVYRDLMGNFGEPTRIFFTSFLERLGLAWWVKIITASPACIYYFGPFISDREAQTLHGGYIEDLTHEGATITNLEIKCFQPSQLTVDIDLIDAD